MNKMKDKTTATLLIAIFMISIFVVAVSISTTNPTTIDSSTMHFESVDVYTLIQDGTGYIGVIPLINENGR